jgi:hypothetical protein
MGTTTMPMPTELRELFEKFCRLGALLPTIENFSIDDPLAMADCEMTLQEMAEVQAQIEAFGRRHRER